MFQRSPLILTWIDFILTEEFVNKRKDCVNDDHDNPGIVPDNLSAYENDERKEQVGPAIHEKSFFSKTVNLLAWKCPFDCVKNFHFIVDTVNYYISLNESYYFITDMTGCIEISVYLKEFSSCCRAEVF